MCAAWHMGPPITPFSHTSNSQYGAFTGSGYGGSTPTARKVGGPYIPTPPAPRISDVTSRDVARIVAAVDPKDKFSDFMSKYDSGRNIPLTSHYDKVLTIHDAGAPKRILSQTSGTAPETDVRAENLGRAIHNEIIATARNIPASYSTGQKYSTLPSRSRSDSLMLEPRDLSLQRSHSDMDALSDSMRIYMDMKRTDTNNNMFHSNGYMPADTVKTPTKPSYSRSNTFNGTGSTLGENLASRYADSRIGLDKLFARPSESRYISSYRSPGSAETSVNGYQPLNKHSRDYVTQGTRSHNTDISLDKYSKTRDEREMQRDLALPRDYGRDNGLSRGNDFITNRDTSRDHVSKNGDYETRNPVYWLYGNQGRTGFDVKPNGYDPKRSGNQSRPSDYLMKLDSSGNARSPPKSHEDVGIDGLYDRNRDTTEYGSYLDRIPYSNRPQTPYSSEPLPDDPYGTNTADWSKDIDITPPEIISYSSGSHKSILKRQGKSVSHVTGSYSVGPTSIFRSAHEQKQLPILPYTSSGTLGRGNSGKKVTFNLAKNKFRAILD